MYKYGFFFLTLALTKLWLSVIFTINHMFKVLNTYGSLEGDVIDNLDPIIIAIVIVELVVAIICFSIHFMKGKTN